MVAERITRLRATRLDRGLTQRELSELTGIPLRSLERLDRGEVDDISFRWLVNLTIALQCRPGDISEPEWLTWKPDITPATPRPRPPYLPERASRTEYQRAWPRKHREPGGPASSSTADGSDKLL